MKRKLWEVWKREKGKWAVQFPCGIMTFKTKKQAVKISESQIEIGHDWGIDK